MKKIKYINLLKIFNYNKILHSYNFFFIIYNLYITKNERMSKRISHCSIESK